MSPPISKARRALFATSSVVLSLAVLEGGARLLIALSPRVEGLSKESDAYKTSDPEFGMRGNPDFPDHDEAGFRNARRPERATVVAIGDSQTYSSETSREDAWPQLAQSFSGIDFYNLGLGGYGPLQYWLLVDEALALEPEWVVVALYEGNDYYDAYRDIYLRPLDTSWQDPSLRDELFALDEHGKALHQDWWDTRVARKAPGKAYLIDFLRWLDYHLAVYDLVEGTVAVLSGPPPRPKSRVRENFPKYVARADGAEPGLLEPFEDGDLSTIFTPRGRLQPLLPDDPRARESIRLTLRLLDEIAARCEGRTRLGVAFIPTKELVYASRVARRGGAGLHESYARLVEIETEVRQRTMDHLDALGVPWVDSLPELRASLEAGRRPYGMNWNGHPNPEGNAAIARAALSLVKGPDDDRDRE